MPGGLPVEARCKTCGVTKPTDEMVVHYRRAEKAYYVRPRCKECHNAKERGHRREYKRDYLRKWRKRNRELCRTYHDNDAARESAKIRARRRSEAERQALLIQGRLSGVFAIVLVLFCIDLGRKNL